MPRLVPPPALPALQSALDSLDAAIAGSQASAGTLEVAALARKWAIIDERYPPRIAHLYEVAVRFTSSDAPPPEPGTEASVELEAAAPASADTPPALREGEIDI